MPESLTLSMYRNALQQNPNLGREIVEVYQHGSGSLSIRYANGRLSHNLELNSLVFHPDVLSVTETRFVVSTMNIPLTPYNNPYDPSVQMIYVISGVFLELGGGYHFRTEGTYLTPSTPVAPSHHHHKCSRCKKVRTCSGRYCSHMIKLHCDDCNEYFILKRGVDDNNISLDTETNIPLNIHNSGADWAWATPVPEARPVESRSGRIPSNAYNISFNDNANAASWNLDRIVSVSATHNDALITGCTGGNEDSNF